MNNLTKLFCDLLSAGSQLGDTSVPTSQVVDHIKSLAVHSLPEDCDVNFDDLEEHIVNVRAALSRGADFDIDKVR